MIPGDEEDKQVKDGANKNLLATSLVSLLLRSKRSSGLFETEAPDQVRSPSRLSPVKTLMSHPLPSRESEQLATSRLSLTVALRPMTGKNTCLMSGSWNGRIKAHDGTLKKTIACKLCANARL